MTHDRRTSFNERREHVIQGLNEVWESLNDTRIAYSPGKVAEAMDKLMTQVNELRLVMKGWGPYETAHFD